MGDKESRATVAAGLQANYSAVSLGEARKLLSRAVDKCEALRRSGTFIVVDASGAPVSAVRMDGCPPGALPLVRAKAFGTAVNGEPSAQFAARMYKFGAVVFATYQAVLRDQAFAGAGGMLVKEGDRVVGAIATGLGIGPFVKWPGVEQSQLIADGQPANLEDILISYALGVPYSAQHGDDMARWKEAYGSAPDPAQKGTAMSPAPAATRQAMLSRARALSDHAMQLAEQKNVRASVVIVDVAGDVVTLDRMDGAAPMGVDVATAVAVAAVNFGVASGEIASLKHYAGALDRLFDVVPYRMLALPGGYPIRVGGLPAGAVGVHCPDPDLAQQIARSVAEWALSKFDRSEGGT